MDIMDEVFAEEDQRERIMASELAALRAELRAEHDALREACKNLSAEAWPCKCGEPGLVIDPQTLAELDTALAASTPDPR